jgi:glycosyltransferase involved in cell wall biosynthesis
MNGTRICLAMIVKDEAPVIARCLQSVRPVIHHWIVCDTGSADATPDLVRALLHDLPGTLHDRPWVDFAHNRSEALALARPHADYTLVIDADDVLELPPGFRLPQLAADCYTLEIRQGRLRHQRPQLLRSALPWRYEGVLHEFLSVAGPDGRRILPQELGARALPGVAIRTGVDGARRQRPAAERFAADAAILERALAAETDPFLAARYQFYLAQSYRDAGDKEKALAAYLRRAALAARDQEAFVSLYQAGRLKAELGHDAEAVIATYLQAHELCPERAEALFWAAHFCRMKQRMRQAIDLAKRGLAIARPADGLFLESWIYEYGLLDEYAGAAFALGRHEECLRACRKMLAAATLPEADRLRIAANAREAERLARARRAR